MLNEEQKEFIRKHHKETSAKLMAGHLNAPKHEVKKFIKELGEKRPLSLPSKYNKFLIPLAVLALLLIHVSLRYNTFWLSHLRGDQNQYVGLAMKLDKEGINGYNLRGIDLRPVDEKGQVFAITPSADEEGSMLAGLKHSGAGYYDIPFFHKGPAFSMALTLSHRLFGGNRDYLLVQQHLGDHVYKLKPSGYFSSQFYAVIVPLFFSAALMLMTFILGKMLFSWRIGIYAAFMMAVNPISIMTSCKLWADDMLAAFVILSVILFIWALEKDNLWLSLLGGISCGISVLAKQSGGIIFGGLILYSVLIKHSIKHLMTYGIGLTLISGPWFYKVYRTYGDPIYMPVAPDIRETDTTGWFKLIGSRPHPAKLFSIGIPYLCPPFALVYVSVIRFVKRLRWWDPNEKASKEGDHVALLWFWILSFTLFFIFYAGGDEHRRMLPVYPAIAILSAYVLDGIRMFIGKLFNNCVVAEAMIAGLLIVSALWAAPMGISTVLENGAVIMKPF